MTLNDLWFVLIAILWIGYFVLEGFDFGVGILLYPVGKDERGRRTLINAIGPLWDGNEVWVLTAGGAMFAAFPQWYATVFSGWYLPLLIILVCLIVRGLYFEYRGKGDTDRWRRNWDRAIAVTSVVPSLLWGVAFGGFVHGVPLASDHEFAGNFFDLIVPFALVTGLTTLALFTTHGAVFLALKTRGEVRERARGAALSVGIVAVVVLAVAVIWQQVIRPDTWALVIGIAAVVAALGSWLSTRAERDGWAFIGSAAAIALLTVSWFAELYPTVLPSTTDPAGTLDVHNAASSHYTLTVMTWVAVIMVPFVLAYQAWSYWVFRRRLSSQQIPMPAPVQVGASTGSGSGPGSTPGSGSAADTEPTG